MTKDAYFEMCAVLGSEPLEEEIPVEFEDFYTDVQEAFIIYYKLKDEWDGFSGNYLGKNYSGILDIFKILEIPEEDWKTTFDLIGLIDSHRSEYINKRNAQKRAQNPT